MKFRGKRLGVFGDSFADTSNLITSELSWVNLLSKQLEFSEVTNYALGSTSFYYSYKKFKNNYSKYDVSIILVTDPFRHTKDPIYLPSLNDYVRLSNLITVENLLKNHNLSTSEINLLNTTKSWFIDKDERYMYDMHLLMLEDIKKIDATVCMIPCFKSSIPTSKCCLNDLLTEQTKSLGWSNKRDSIFSQYEEDTNELSCHFTPETNKFLANLIQDQIENTVVKVSYSNIVYNVDFRKYYKRKIVKQ